MTAAESVNFDFYEVTTEAARHLRIGKVHPTISKPELQTHIFDSLQRAKFLFGAGSFILDVDLGGRRMFPFKPVGSAYTNTNKELPKQLIRVRICCTHRSAGTPHFSARSAACMMLSNAYSPHTILSPISMGRLNDRLSTYCSHAADAAEMLDWLYQSDMGVAAIGTTLLHPLHLLVMTETMLTMTNDDTSVELHL